MYKIGGGWVRQRYQCYVSYVTGASNWYWLTVGQGLLSLQQVRVEGICSYFFCSITVIHFPFSSVPLFHLLCHLFCLSSFLWERTQNDPQELTCQLDQSICVQNISLKWLKINLCIEMMPCCKYNYKCVCKTLCLQITNAKVWKEHKINLLICLVFFPKYNHVIYSSFPIRSPSFKALAQIFLNILLTRFHYVP